MNTDYNHDGSRVGYAMIGAAGGSTAIGEVSQTRNAVDLGLDAGALFDVFSHPVMIGDETPTITQGKYKGSPSQVAVYRRNDDGTPHLLNVTHPSFPISNYLQVLETAEALFPESTTAVKVLDNGERLMFTQEIGDLVNDLLGKFHKAPTGCN